MATVSRTETIDGLRFTVSQLPARRAVKLALRVGRIAGPALMPVLQGALAAEVKGKGKGAAGALQALGSLDVGALAPAVEGFFERMKDEDLDYLQQELLENALINDAPLWPQFDVAMQGRLTTVFKLLWLALRVQFQNFSGAHPANP